MTRLIIYITLIGYILTTVYILYPNPEFPNPPSDSLQSAEPADTETSSRRAYFTNFTREEVVKHYLDQANYLPTLRLNYPPEEAQTKIRDQTRSTYLEELAHPLRESIYINGFEPRQQKDDIWYRGQHFEQKIIIKQVNSVLVSRLAINTLTFAAIFALLLELKNESNHIKKHISNILHG